MWLLPTGTPTSIRKRTNSRHWVGLLRCGWSLIDFDISNPPRRILNTMVTDTPFKHTPLVAIWMWCRISDVVAVIMTPSLSLKTQNAVPPRREAKRLRPTQRSLRCGFWRRWHVGVWFEMLTQETTTISCGNNSTVITIIFIDMFHRLRAQASNLVGVSFTTHARGRRRKRKRKRRVFCRRPEYNPTTPVMVAGLTERLSDYTREGIKPSTLVLFVVRVWSNFEENIQKYFFHSRTNRRKN